MNPVALAGPAVEPVSLAEAKLFLRLDETDEDELVAALIVAARTFVERATGLALLEQSCRWRVDAPGPAGVRDIALPLSPALAVMAVRSLPVGSPPVPLDPALYRLDATRDPPRLVLEEPAAGPVEVDASYGFGPDAAAVPAPIRLAIRMLVARSFENRGDRPTPDEGGIPEDVRALLAPYRPLRLA